ncbi:3'-5' exonuclease [Candidatus Peregrinibacteria bacterium]|jgi:DNA polymerase III subunit alpha, Gram-positive type|nr:3'-5' exonuclease [Candidatus Peregrinibacteria bacterium]
MIRNTTFVVVDTETTGATAAQDRIVEIGAVKVVNGEIVDTYQTLLNPKRLIPHNVIQIHRITDNMVINEPFFEDIIGEFLEFMGGDSVLVAHNLEFDRGFINEELKRIGHMPLPNQGLCTLKLSRKVFPDFRKYGLGHLSKTLGIELSNAHRALADSMATAEILLRIFDELENQGKTTLKDINLKRLKQESTLSLF